MRARTPRNTSSALAINVSPISPVRRSHRGRTSALKAIAALQMLNEGCKATAVQAVSDLVAIGCANALLSQGLKIPEDVSIVGFGNILAAEYFQVPLTTIRQPKHRLGVAAVETMMALLRGEKVQPKRLPAELVHRKSSAPPKS